MMEALRGARKAASRGKPAPPGAAWIRTFSIARRGKIP